jgi:hypothetical protein
MPGQGQGGRGWARLETATRQGRQEVRAMPGQGGRGCSGGLALETGWCCLRSK